MKTKQEIRDRITWLNTQIEESKDMIKDHKWEIISREPCRVCIIGF